VTGSCSCPSWSARSGSGPIRLLFALYPGALVFVGYTCWVRVRYKLVCTCFYFLFLHCGCWLWDWAFTWELHLACMEGKPMEISVSLYRIGIGCIEVDVAILWFNLQHFCYSISRALSVCWAFCGVLRVGICMMSWLYRIVFREAGVSGRGEDLGAHCGGRYKVG
jgi:hypothetical protein